MNKFLKKTFFPFLLCFLIVGTFIAKPRISRAFSLALSASVQYQTIDPGQTTYIYITSVSTGYTAGFNVILPSSGLSFTGQQYGVDGGGVQPLNRTFSVQSVIPSNKDFGIEVKGMIAGDYTVTIRFTAYNAYNPQESAAQEKQVTIHVNSSQEIEAREQLQREAQSRAEAESRSRAEVESRSRADESRNESIRASISAEESRKASIEDESNKEVSKKASSEEESRKQSDVESRKQSSSEKETRGTEIDGKYYIPFKWKIDAEKIPASFYFALPDTVVTPPSGMKKTELLIDGESVLAFRDTKMVEDTFLVYGMFDPDTKPAFYYYHKPDGAFFPYSDLFDPSKESTEEKNEPLFSDNNTPYIGFGIAIIVCSFLASLITYLICRSKKETKPNPVTRDASPMPKETKTKDSETEEDDPSIYNLDSFFEELDDKKPDEK